MITCNMIGRMGNQMFQIATTAAHAWRTGQQYAFPATASGSYTGETYFPHLPKVNPRRPFRVYNEKSHHYTPIPTHLTDVKLNGYWQCEKYFKEYRQEVIDLFGLKPVFCDADFSLHIRLTDYIAFKDKHPPITVDYINKAIAKIKETQYVETCMVFSDDLKQAEELVMESDYMYSGIDFKFCRVTDPKESMCLMAGCDHNIIANSSFSWWGAWLNPNPDKIVIAPKVWFGPGNSNLTDRDIVPENWIRL